MRLIGVAVATAIALTGCASVKQTLPENYQGPKATIKDSTKRYSSQKADIFYIDTVDGESVLSSPMRTRAENQGKMFFMRVYLVSHDFPIQATTLGIRGETQYAAPILALTNPVYRVEGKVQFTPEAGKVYVIKGELGEDYSAVWVEEEQTHTVIDKKIEIDGSAKVGFFQK